MKIVDDPGPFFERCTYLIEGGYTMSKYESRNPLKKNWFVGFFDTLLIHFRYIVWD